MTSGRMRRMYATNIALGPCQGRGWHDLILPLSSLLAPIRKQVFNTKGKRLEISATDLRTCPVNPHAQYIGRNNCQYNCEVYLRYMILQSHNGSLGP